MIEVHVLEDRAMACEFIEKYEISEDCVLLYASERGREAGFVALTCLPPDMTIMALDGEDGFVSELLLRAAFSYGERRGAVTVFTALKQPESLLERVGFRLIDGQMTARVDNVVHMCRNCAESTK